MSRGGRGYGHDLAVSPSDFFNLAVVSRGVFAESCTASALSVSRWRFWWAVRVTSGPDAAFWRQGWIWMGC